MILRAIFTVILVCCGRFGDKQLREAAGHRQRGIYEEGDCFATNVEARQEMKSGQDCSTLEFGRAVFQSGASFGGCGKKPLDQVFVAVQLIDATPGKHPLLHCDYDLGRYCGYAAQ